MRFRKTKIALLTIALFSVLATTVFADTEWEINDDVSNATPLQNSPSEAMYGKIQSLGDVDYFSFYASSRNQTIMFNSPRNGIYSVKVYAYDNIVTPVITGTAQNGYGVMLNFAITLPKMYYVEITGINGSYDASNEYTLIASESWF